MTAYLPDKGTSLGTEFWSDAPLSGVYPSSLFLSEVLLFLSGEKGGGDGVGFCSPFFFSFVRYTNYLIEHFVSSLLLEF